MNSMTRYRSVGLLNMSGIAPTRGAAPTNGRTSQAPQISGPTAVSPSLARFSARSARPAPPQTCNCISRRYSICSSDAPSTHTDIGGARDRSSSNTSNVHDASTPYRCYRRPSTLHLACAHPDAICVGLDSAENSGLTVAVRASAMERVEKTERDVSAQQRRGGNGDRRLRHDEVQTAVISDAQRGRSRRCRIGRVRKELFSKGRS
eukprot:IDg22001t1